MWISGSQARPQCHAAELLEVRFPDHSANVGIVEQQSPSLRILTLNLRSFPATSSQRKHTEIIHPHRMIVRLRKQVLLCMALYRRYQGSIWESYRLDCNRTWVRFARSLCNQFCQLTRNGSETMLLDRRAHPRVKVR